MLNQRRSGVLLHPTSLPGSQGIGTFGKESYDFVDVLVSSSQTLWQVLPLAPPGCGNSPYSAFSAFAGNPLLIDLNTLVSEGDLDKEDPMVFPDNGCVDFSTVEKHTCSLLRKAAFRFFAMEKGERLHDFWNFCDSTFWLHDYALYGALKSHFKGAPWFDWPVLIRSRDVVECSRLSTLLGEEIGLQKYMQWQFYRQWQRLKHYANSSGVLIIGDAPIFVALDSADVWCNQHNFKLDENGLPLVVAGVPPDYFSKTGQRWGNPLYRWDVLAADGFAWWIARLKNDLTLYNILRIDHFRGFEACWEIPVEEETAMNGTWVKVPGEGLFEALKGALGELPLIAEDLGIITPEVARLRESLGLPGMRVMHFAFEGGSGNSYLPHNHSFNSVAYSGTHDNDTTLGWFESLEKHDAERVCEYLSTDSAGLVSAMIRSVFASVAKFAILPMQDLLALPSSGRMNLPGVAGGNWGWRLTMDYRSKVDIAMLKRLSQLYNRNSQQ